MVRAETEDPVGLETHLHDLILELGQEVVDDLVLLDGQRVQVDLLHAVDLASLYETAELGDGLPLLLLGLAATTATATTASTAAVTTTGSETTTTSTAASVSHVVYLLRFEGGGREGEEVVDIGWKVTGCWSVDL